MRFFKYLFIFAILFGGYQSWQKHQAEVIIENNNEFISLPQPINTSKSQVLILAPRNCSSSEAKQAKALAAKLRQKNISYQELDTVSFDASSDPKAINRLNQVMNGTIPIVFVGGKGKANPSIDEVLAEYDKLK